MPEPSIVVDLLLRDLTAASVDAIAAHIRSQLESISIDIPISSPEKLNAVAKATSGVKRSADEASKSLITLGQVYKNPEKYFQPFVEQQRELLELKSLVDEQVQKAVNPKAFLNQKDVLIDKQNYDRFLSQKKEDVEISGRLRDEIAAQTGLTTEQVRAMLTNESARKVLVGGMTDEALKRKLLSVEVQKSLAQELDATQKLLSIQDVIRDPGLEQKYIAQQLEVARVQQLRRDAISGVTKVMKDQQRITLDDVAAGKASKEAYIKDASARMAYAMELEHAVKKATAPLLSPVVRDAMGKRLGRSTVTMEDPFGSLFSTQGAGARFASLFAGQVGTLLVYGAALKVITQGTQEFVKANVELEDSMAKLSTVLESGGTEQFAAEMKDLKELAIDWGRRHAQSAKEAGDAMYYLASAGESVAQIHRNLPAVLSLSYGGFLQAEFAAETAATAYELFGKEGLSMIDIVNRIQKTNAISQVTVEQYASAFTYLASSADQAKISFDEVSAAIGTLGTLGLRGSKGGRNLDEAIGMLLKKQGQLRELGIDVATAGGDLKTFSEILETFRKRLGSKIDVQELKILRDVFGQQGGRALGLLIENTDLYLENLEKVKQSEAEIYDAALKRGETLSQVWENFKNQLQAIAQDTSVLEFLKQLITAQTEAERKAGAYAGLIVGDQGLTSSAIRFALKRAESDLEGGLTEMQVTLRNRFKDERFINQLIKLGLSTDGIVADIRRFSNDVVWKSSAEIKTLLQQLAKELEVPEEKERLRSVVANQLHLQPEKLEILDFTQQDVKLIKANARQYFLSLADRLKLEMALLLKHQELTFPQAIQYNNKIDLVNQILKGILGDMELRKPEEKIKDFFAGLKISISQAQLDALRSIKTVDFRSQLEVIDLELLINLRKNREEYNKQLESIPDEVKNVASNMAEAKRMLRKQLDFKDIADINRAAANIVRVRFEVEFGDKAIPKLKRDLAEARLQLARAVPEELLPIQTRLKLIDDETLIQLEKNKEDYLAKIKGLPDEILRSAVGIDEARNRVIRALDTLASDMTGSSTIVGESAAEIRDALIQLTSALPVDDTMFDEVRKKLIAEVKDLSIGIPRPFTELRSHLVAMLDALPKDMQDSTGRFAAAKKLLEDALTIGDITAKNKAFFQKDRLIREEFLRGFQADIERQRRLQEIMLNEQDAGDEERRIRRNDLLRREILGQLPTLFPSRRAPIEIPSLQVAPFEATDLIKQIQAQIKAFATLNEMLDEVSIQESAKTKIRELLTNFDLAEVSSESLKILIDAIRTLGIESGMTGDELDKFLETISGFDPKIQTTTDLVHAFSDAFGSLAGMMQVVGNENTWNAVAGGISTISKAYDSVKNSLDLLKGGKELQGVLGIMGTVFNVVGFIAGLIGGQEPRNVIGTEEYTYQPGRNVSPDYGRAQTINMQVEMSPNFNFLDPTGLTEQRQREIATALGDELDNYFEETGRFPRR